MSRPMGPPTGPPAGWTPEQVQEASVAEVAAGRLPLQAQWRLATARADGAFGSTLGVAEHHAVRSVGFSPVGQVLGSCVYQIGYTGNWQCGWSTSADRWGGGNWAGGNWAGGNWAGGNPGGGNSAGGAGGGSWGGWAAAGWPGNRMPGGVAGPLRYDPAPGSPVPADPAGYRRPAGMATADGLRRSLVDARRLAMSRMRDECAGLGGDGVVAVRLTVAPFPAGGLEFQAIGTAVRADGGTRPREPFLSDLSGQEFAALITGGWVPCGLVLGVSALVRHDDWATATQRSSWSNQEVTGYTELLHGVRAEVRDMIRSDCAVHGGEAVVLRDIPVWVSERECSAVQGRRDHLAEAFAVGTAVVPFRRSGDRPHPPSPLPVLHL